MGGLTDIFAQITVTSSNIEQSLESEFSATQNLSTDTENLLELAETSGADQVWDFTSVTFEENYTGSYSISDNPSEAPEGDDPHFADATHVTSLELSQTEVIDGEEQEVFVDFYAFGILNEEELVSLGGVLMEGMSENEAESEVMVVYSIPGVIQFQFPLTYESTWEYDYETSFGSDTSDSATEVNVVVEVDGWGEVVTAEGREEVLRITRTETMTVQGFEVQSQNISFVNQNGLEVAAISGYDESLEPENQELQASNIAYSTSTSVEDPNTLPQELVLKQNYPNPFNPSTVISYQLPEASRVQLEVFDMLGQKIATLVQGETKTAGHHTVAFDASDFSSGTYIYRLTAGEHILTKKLMLIK